MSTPQQHNLSERKILTERWLLCVDDSTPHALFGFASSGNHSCLVSLLPVSACRPHHAPPRPHAPLQKLVFLLIILVLLLLLLASCAVLACLPDSFPRAPCATSSLVTTSSRRCRTSPPSCCCSSYSSVSFVIEIASSSPPVLPPSAAAALILLTCLLLGAPLAPHCNLLPGIQLSGVRLRTRARLQYFYCWTPRGTFTSLTTLPRPASCEVDTARAWPPLPFLPSGSVPFVSDNHCQLPSNSADYLVNSAPRLSLRQVVRQNVVLLVPASS